MVASERLRRFALIVWSTIGVLALVWVLWRVADSIRIIWLPLAFAGGLTLILNPIVNAFERLGVPRLLGTIFSFVVLGGVVTATVVLLVPVVRQQASDFAAQLPNLYDTVVDWLHATSDSFGIDLGPVWTSETIREWIQDPANQETIQGVVGGFGSGAGRILRGVTETLAVTVLAPVLAFYMLMDATKFKQRSRELTPASHREEAVYLADQLTTALGSFVRGQLLVALFVGLFSSLGLWIIDVPFWLIIGMVAGVLNLVPFVGPFVGGALAAIVSLFNGSVSQALWAVAIFTLIQQVDNHVITPLVQRTRVNLSPLVIVLSLIVGGSIAGLLGVVIAVPAAAAIRILVGHLWRTRVLGESWHEATSAMIEHTERPDRIAGVRRRRPPDDQQRLFDTAEHPELADPQPVEVTAPSAADEPH
ncbi:MAG TPA: AI-2E family transporter [Acidimicrobiia bacterium]|nr:AI-2E family transporter [Acidimicrobiia bacterium]